MHSAGGRRRLLLGLLGLYLAGLVRITLWPEPFEGPARGVVETVLAWLSRQDVAIDVDSAEKIANVLLFVPLGALLMLLLPGGAVRRSAFAVGIGVWTSVVVETTQWAFLPTRVPTPVDVVTNTLGTVLGVAVVLVVQRARARRAARGMRRASQPAPPAVVATGRGMMTPVTPAPAALRVLVVCTGNICRSPAVERLLRQAWEGSDVVVTSAGTRAMVGDPISPLMAQLLEENDGVDTSGFAARQLTSALVEGSDVVLALTRAHRSEVVGLQPAALRRTFTLRELARLLEHVPPGSVPAGTSGERLAGLVPLAVVRRGTSTPRREEDDDVVDPYGRGEAAYRRSYAQLAPAVRAIVAATRG